MEGLFGPAKVVLRLAFVLALLVFLALPTFYLTWPTGDSVSLAALETHGKVESGDISYSGWVSGRNCAGARVQSIQFCVASRSRR